MAGIWVPIVRMCRYEKILLVLCHTVIITFMKKELSAVIFLLFLCLLLGVFFVVGFGFDGAGRVSPGVALTSDMDSEKLLYDDVFMDEAIRSYTLRSLTASLSRLGYARGIDCHDRAHELGRRAYEVVGSEAFKSCGIECHSGCRHGATEAFFAEHGTADLVGSMQTLCGDEAGNRFHMHQCIHGIGHGLMAWYDYGLYDALAACDLIRQEYHRKSCYSGVFMENIVGSIRSGEGEEYGYHHTEYLSDDLHYPCNAVEDKYKYECYWLQTDQMHRLLGDFGAVGEACAEAPEPFRFSCFHSMGRTVSGRLLLHPAKSYEVCMAVAYVPGRDGCLEGVLNNSLWDPSQAGGAIEFCALSLGSSFEEVCYDRLMTQIAEVVPQQDTHRLCKKLPKQYQVECVQREIPRAVPLSSDLGVPIAVEKTDNAVIRYMDGRYIPDMVHISVGQKVVWVNEDGERLFWPASNIHPTHTAYPRSDIRKCGTDEQGSIFDACAGLPRGAEYSFVFTRVGQWRFHDHINPRATGTVIVSE